MDVTYTPHLSILSLRVLALRNSRGKCVGILTSDVECPSVYVLLLLVDE